MHDDVQRIEYRQFEGEVALALSRALHEGAQRAEEGPSAIRRASRMLVDGAHPHHWVEPAASMDIADAGDFAIVLGDLAARSGVSRPWS